MNVIIHFQLAIKCEKRIGMTVLLREQYFDHCLKQPEDSSGLYEKKVALLRETPRNTSLYKYCSLETAAKILSSGHVLLRTPDNFNDPFDCLTGINVFTSGPEVRFLPSKDDLEYVVNLIKRIPEKYQIPDYRMFDQRASYCVAISCFTSKFDNHLMWSHYANSHRGVCLEFNVADLMAHLHPCVYAHRMPDVQWNTDAIALSLIKNGVWSYEDEWRYVKRTIRPKLRLFGTVTSDIYNAVHKNAAFTRIEHEEWSTINSSMHKELEDAYNEELKLPITPTSMYCGLKFGSSGNTFTQEQTNLLLETSIQKGMKIHKIVAKHNTFDLGAVQVLPPFGPMTFSS